MLFILAQICGALGISIAITSMLYKTKEKIIMSQIIANILVTIQYFLLNALSGGVLNAANTIRCVIFYYYKKKDKKPSLTFLIIFIVVAIILGAISWQNIWSIMPIIGAIVFTYGLWQDNLKVMRICSVVTTSTLAIYSFIVMAYAGGLGLVGECIASVVALIKYHGKKGGDVKCQVK